MTALDKFEPVGEPIHPYDLYEFLNRTDSDRVIDVWTKHSSPAAEDEADYFRNIHKTGTVIEVDGKVYFATSAATPITTRFA